jgi:SpoVK/Ycf46/Vps4 family AAA+-type ATPase
MENPMSAQLKPSEIVRQLSQHVIGQEDAKRTLAVAIYAHFRRMSANAAEDSVELTKSNILLIGPTGTGKTLLCETLARILDVPFVTADATSLAQTQFVGDEIEAILHRLLDRASDDIDRAQRGIVLSTRSTSSRPSAARPAPPRAKASSMPCSRSWKAHRYASRTGGTSTPRTSCSSAAAPLSGWITS